ncbi:MULTISPECIES: DUF1289 domain-containing protein [Providencia]|uniref:DUF1289 domain-containing protein n=1 Tax=Providencia TaxID=586 RepID=UPI00198095D2|nr:MULTISPECIES: DUF1289 domain-containing protein [Providencia]HEC8329257.1 DUF1289 domain-containing protein [Providencia rettgeri]MBN4865226.1 DUF1289 domain-containing protein [Providencia stuartii]MBN4874548.1 DUF1289 domain-containing protein [Providencia stuartii]MBN4879239.1 DUF1289 domain-containing protein [Providencia stuartii]MBN4883749.1 DUF1289 domain-containing protein [Providencia stuartii]
MAEQLEFFDIPSPCRSICQTNEQGYCLGCYRTRDERFNWLKFSNAEKRNIIRLCRQRYLRTINKKVVQGDVIDSQQQLFNE